MANPFDQFDAPSAPAAPPAASNPFDRFDAPAPQAKTAEVGGFRWPSLSSVFNGMVNGAQGTVDYLTTPDPSKPTLSGMAKSVASAAQGGLDLTQQAMAGTLDPTSEDAIRKAAEVAAIASPVSAGSAMARGGVAAAANTPTQAGAEALGIGLTAGQRTGDPALLSTENAMFGGAMGDNAQRIAQAGVARQKEEVAAAKEAIGQQAGRGLAQIDRPADAGDAVVQAVRQRAADAKAEIGRRYDAVRDEPGTLDPAFFTGAPKAAEGAAPAVPGSAQADFAAPLSRRVTDSLVNRQDPVIIDATLTPAAHKALSELDNVTNLRLGSIGQPGAADEVVGINLRGVDQARRKLAAYSRAAAANPSDQRAVRAIVNEFDAQVQDAMERGLFSGSDAALDKLKDARAAYASYQKTFKPQGAGDDVGRAMQAIVEREPTPEEVANYLYGGTKVGAAGRSVRVADRLKDVLGPDSPEWAAIRQGAWQRVLGPMEAGPAVSAKRIADFVMGDGQSLSSRLFSADEKAEMMRLANVLKAISTRPGTVNPSNSGNRLAGLARQSISAIGAMLGAKIQGVPGAAAGYITGKGLEALSSARNASQARQLFAGEAPIGIAERLRQAGVGIGQAAGPRLITNGVGAPQGFSIGFPFGPGALPVRADDQNQPSGR